MGLTAVLSRALVVFLFNADLRTSRKPHQAENVTDPHCVWAQAALAEEGSQPAGSLLPGQCPSAPPPIKSTARAGGLCTWRPGVPTKGNDS